MLPIKLSQAVTACNGQFFGDAACLETAFTAVSTDTRTITEGALFVPIKGERFDGHDFIKTAFENGACCTLSDRPVDYGPYILVNDTTEAFQRLAAFYKSLMPARTVGITGSVGKTTTKECVAAVLKQAYSTLYSQGNLNNQTGVPQTIFRMEQSYTAAVIEMGTNHFGEIDSLARMVRPDICLLTNIGTAHMEFFGSREGILRGKSEMLPHMAPGGHVLVNGDDDMLIRLKNCRTDVTTFGIGDHNDLRAIDIQDLGLLGMAFTAVSDDGFRLEIRIPSPGMHMVYNALAACQVGRFFGMEPADIQKGLAGYTALSGRMCIEATEKLTILNDVYNANPNSMKSAIDVLTKAAGRKVCVLGNMGELGENWPQFHREVGEYAAKKQIDVILAVGDMAEEIANGARAAGASFVQHFHQQECLLKALPELLKSGDAVLVKASRSMQLERTVAFLKEY